MSCLFDEVVQQFGHLTLCVDHSRVVQHEGEFRVDTRLLQDVEYGVPLLLAELLQQPLPSVGQPLERLLEWVLALKLAELGESLVGVEQLWSELALHQLVGEAQFLDEQKVAGKARIEQESLTLLHF
jgi:hypothetical protein